MNEKELKIYKNVISILKRKHFLKTDKDVLEENFTDSLVKEYYYEKYLKRLSIEERNKILSSIRSYYNYFTPSIVGENDNFRIFVPKVNSVSDALIYVHELTHAIYFLHNNFSYITDEIMPFEAERIFLKDFNLKCNILKNKVNDAILSIKSNTDNENIKYIYALIIMMLYEEIDKEIIYSSNQLLDLKENGYVINKKIYRLL